jgi:Na+-driven multidrug efflux pump
MVKKRSGVIVKYIRIGKESRSLMLKSYVFVSFFVGFFSLLLLVLANITWIANPIASDSNLFREQYLITAVLLLVIIPLFIPLFVVSERYIKGLNNRWVDFYMACTGYVFIGALFLGLLISDPKYHMFDWPMEMIGKRIDMLPNEYGIIPIGISIVIMLIAVKLVKKLN